MPVAAAATLLKMRLLVLPLLRLLLMLVVVVWPQGGMLKAERDKVVREFRSGITKILISTDVLARGFDVSQVGCLTDYRCHGGWCG